ncbi:MULTISPECIES: hypothetical protein [Providencia]|uniref:Uncharacterized protein n=3 Tax=Providencia TaxID=586 RepID=A0A809S038_PRORE|nr:MULTISPECIES: hypothetical protein [Providencia]EHZ6871760.1 hypothetical protein [Providencia rettgeri]MBG5926217.1 hypothetical protein [Providencia rettgeri]MBN6366605.1 hypothetical protein [Providencia rettgeri]MBN7841523.1 hypothetical protein [Providencia rettgeri]MBN7853869.1 hypothetical protein [Providencia rettgeri]
MKMPASLWVILIVFSLFMLIHITGAFFYVSSMLRLSSSVDVWSSSDGAFLIIGLTLYQLVLPTVEVLTVVLVLMKKKIGAALLKILWSIITLMSIFSAFKGINNALEGNGFSSMAEKTGGVIGVLLLPIIMIFLTYILFKSSRVKDYFQSVSAK